MSKKRLFTFGCSFTQYKWPTWADILGLNFDEFYNFGQPGSGIFYMLYHFVHGNEYYKFNENDTLIFMLSDEARYDIINDDEWLNKGLIYNSENVYGKKFIEKFTPTHAVESSYVYISLLKEKLDKIGCKYEIVYAFEPFFENSVDLFGDDVINIWNKKYNLTNKNIDSLSNFSKSVSHSSYYLVNDLSKEKYLDGHCNIFTNLRYVKKYFSKYYDEKYDSIVNQWNGLIKDGDNDTDVEMTFRDIVLKNKVMFLNGKIKKDFT